MEYTYKFSVYPAGKHGLTSATRLIFDKVPVRLALRLTEIAFEEFRAELAQDGLEAINITCRAADEKVE